MNASIIVLLGYISWTLLLLLTLALYRSYLSQSGKFKGLKFQSDGSDVPGFGNRLTRAQANCVECRSIAPEYTSGYCPHLSHRRRQYLEKRACNP